MELINITQVKHPFGFSKPETVTYSGVQFDDGKIAYQQTDGNVYTTSVNELDKHLPGAKVEPAIITIVREVPSKRTRKNI